MTRTVTSVDDCVFVHSMFAGCTGRGLAQFDCWRVQELFLSCLNLWVQGVFAVCCTTCIICCTVFMAGLSVSNGLTPVAGANLGRELMSKYLDWLPDEEAFDQLLGLFVFNNVVMKQNLSSVHSY